MTTPRLGAPELVQSQAVPETTVNEIARYLEAFATRAIVKDRDLATPPGSPADGDAYLVASSPTGAWSGQAGKIALRISTSWVFVTAKEGFEIEVEDEDAAYTLRGGVWVTSGGGSSGLDAEQVRDTVAAFLVAGSNVTLTHDDGADTLTVAASAGSSSAEPEGIQGSSGVLRFIYASGGSGGTAQVGGVWSNSGSVGSGGPIAGTRLSRAVRHQRNTGTSVAQSAGLYSLQYLFRDAGFTYEHLGGIDTLVAGHRYFIGVRGSSSIALNSDPSSFTNAIGFGRDSADTNMQLMHNDASGACTKIDTGIGVAAGDVFFVRITAVANGDVTCRLERFLSANSSGTTPDDDYEVTIAAADNLPTASQAMVAGAVIGNAGTAASGIVALIRDSILTPM